MNISCWSIFEAGISLQGSEIKSIRSGQISLAESYIKIDGEERGWLMLTSHLMKLASRFGHDPRRPRRLLLHKRKVVNYGMPCGRKA